MAGCPPEDRLRDYLAAVETTPALEPIEYHLETCTRCAAAAADMVESDPMLARLRIAQRARDSAKKAIQRLEHQISTTLNDTDDGG